VQTGGQSPNRHLPIENKRLTGRIYPTETWMAPNACVDQRFETFFARSQ